MIKLRQYQSKAAPTVFEYLAKHKSSKHPLIGMPTGAGKSYVMADIIEQATRKWGVKVVVLSHVKEILQQDYNSIKKFIPQAGLYSAGLDRREIKQVTVAGIQSAYRNAKLFRSIGKPLVIIIDEAHMVSDKEKSMYQTFFKEVGRHVRIGLTATPYRLGTGYIYGKGEVFDDIVYDMTSKKAFNKLVDQGYLCKLITKGTKLKMDTEGVRTTAGDFNEKDLALKFNKESITNAALDEIVKAGEGRDKWLIFAIDIDHAEHIAEQLLRRGIMTNVVHSKMDSDRDKVIEGFRNGKLRCLVNINILTTGFDVPAVDLVAMLRPTKSPVLHVQSIGRGLRVHDDKSDCLVLDFAGNTARLGPINDVVVHKAKKSKEGGEPITKECPDCASIVPPVVKICPDCGHEFKFKINLTAQASGIDVVAGQNRWVDVDSISYKIHNKRGSPTSLLVEYTCGIQIYKEWVCIEHKGYAKHTADHWVKFRGGQPCGTVNDFMRQKDGIKVPVKILLERAGPYTKVTDARF